LIFSLHDQVESDSKLAGFNGDILPPTGRGVRATTCVTIDVSWYKPADQTRLRNSRA
jgi:hypothetical protein